MYPHGFSEPGSAGSRIAVTLAWLGGGHWGELGERHERSSYAIAGAIVSLDAALAWLVATLAVVASTGWPLPAIAPITLMFGLLVGAVTRAAASGVTRNWVGIVGRGAIAVAVGVVAGELAAMVLFGGSIDRSLDTDAARTAASTPAVAQASADLNRTRGARAALDAAVDQARGHRDEALVVARCEYNPTPACPQTRITGVPGAGPETRTANDLLADAQRELDNALATRDQRAPELDSQIAAGEQALTQARQAAVADADRGLGARWVAMHEYTMTSPGALLLRLATIAFFALLSLLPLILRLWRGETTHDRRAAARTERDRAELLADTAIAVKRAEVRAAAETMWADQQLANARLAVEAQTEIDRVEHHRRVIEALEDGTAAAQLPPGEPAAPVNEPQNLPARVESGAVAAPHGGRGSSLVPTIPDVTKAAARWIRPLVPPFLARALDNTTQPLRTARQVFEEVEEITFALRRIRRVTVGSEQGHDEPGLESAATETRATQDLSIGAAGPQPHRGLKDAQRRQLHRPDGPRQLPPKT
jgi:hypothetical protein